MGAFNWENFLRRWSQDLLESMGEDEKLQLPSAVLESGWLGYSGATEEEIARAEARLGVKLPPSYRAFLKVSNGWRQTAKRSDNFNHRFWSTEDIERFSVRHLKWIKSFTEHTETIDIGLEDASEFDDQWEAVGVSDQEYFVYGEAQDPRNVRHEYLKTAIEISDVGFDSIYLLNPQVVTPEGEWEVWFFADYLPGADRYRSFQEMMETEYRNYLELRELEVTEDLDKHVSDTAQNLDDASLGAYPESRVDVPVNGETASTRVPAGHDDYLMASAESISKTPKEWRVNAIAEPLELEILQISIQQSALPSITISAEKSPTFKSSEMVLLNSKNPFSIEAKFQLMIPKSAEMKTEEAICKTQFFVQDRATHKWIELGRTPPTLLENSTSVYATMLFNQTLQSGVYRMQVVTSVLGAISALKSIELPLLNVA